jgi:hypothetical protein
VTNCFIVANAIRHWNDREIKVEVMIYENPKSNQNTYAKGWNYLGMDGDTRIEKVCRETTEH